MKVNDRFTSPRKLTDLKGTEENPWASITQRVVDAAEILKQNFGKKYDKVPSLSDITKTPTLPNRSTVMDFQIPSAISQGGKKCLHLNCTGCKNGTCSGIHMISCPCVSCSPRF